MHFYRKKTIIILHSMMLVFFMVFLFAYVQLKREVAILNIGLSFYVENMMIIAFSFISILMVLYEIVKVEHHHEYERRMKRKEK